VSRRLPFYVLAALVIGLALHNLAMATLWDWGVRGTALDVVSAWKEALLAVGLVAAIWHARRLPPLRAADLLAAVYAAIVLLYALIPQGWLDGAASCWPCATISPPWPPTRSGACSSSPSVSGACSSSSPRW
jgi:hypothetical protein